MAGRVDQLELDRGEPPGQQVCAQRWRDQVEPSLHDVRGQPGDAIRPVEQLTLAQEAAVHQVVVLEQRQRSTRLLVLAQHALGLFLGAIDRRQARLVPGPALDGRLPLARIVARHGFEQLPGIVGHVRAGNDELQPLPGVGEEHRRPAVVQEVDLLAGAQEHAAQHQAGDALGVTLGVGQREGRPPRPAEQDRLAPDAHVVEQPVDVLDQVVRRVLAPLAARPAAQRSALIEQQHVEATRIEVAAHRRRGRAAGPSMEHDHRDALGIADHLPVQLVQVRDAQVPAARGLDRRKQLVPRGPGARRQRQRPHRDPERPYPSQHRG